MPLKMSANADDNALIDECADRGGAMQQSCWEFTQCGRQPGGPKTGELGVCPAAIEKRADGLNHGTNGGRCCWAVAGTFCGGKVQGAFASKLANCMVCEFYKKVVQEEGAGLVKNREVLSRLG